jgi:hypothetical protein
MAIPAAMNKYPKAAEYLGSPIRSLIQPKKNCPSRPAKPMAPRDAAAAIWLIPLSMA